MRPSALLAALALLATLIAPAPAAAQEAVAPLVLLEDDASDVSAFVNGNPVDVPDGSWDSMDLRSLSVLEGPETLEFILAVTSLGDDTSQNILASTEYEVVFRHVDQVYKVRAFVYDATQSYGVLESLPDGGDPDTAFGSYVADVPVTVDLEAHTLTAAVGRAHLIDSQGATPSPGRVLDLFSVDAGFLHDGSSSILGVPMQLPYLEDRMPESGFGDVALPFVHGIEQVGDLHLASDEPFRASNGEATTFVYRVNATNLASEDVVAEFKVVGAPAAWQVRVPGPMRLSGNQTVEVPIVVQTAFNHAHGTATAITLELASSDGASIGRIQIGVRYPKIAQPAGHHDTVWLHNIGASDAPLNMGVGLLNKALGGYDFYNQAYFNTAEGADDPTDAATNVPGQDCENLRLQEDNDTIGTTYCWDVALSPSLEMGLDFDLTRDGSYTVPIHSLAPQPGARVQGRLLHLAPEESQDPFFAIFGEPKVVATLLPSDRVDIGPNGQATFTGTIRAEKEGDFLPYQRGAQLYLVLEVRTGRPDNFFLGPNTEPELMPGASMVLPLLDYADAIDDVYGVAGVLHLAVDGPAERLGNPGDTLVYDVSLHNADVDAHELTALLVGSNREWATLLGEDEFEVPADGQRGLRVAITVPAGATDGERADLVLELASADDVGVRALVRLVATADTDAEHDDQAALLSDAAAPADTPAPPVAWLLLALAGLAVALRRK